MSQYNNYAKSLDSAFKEARDEHTRLISELNKAKAELESAKAWKPGEDKQEKETAIMRATVAYKDAENALRNSTAWESFNSKRSELRAALAAELQANSIVNPDAIDAAALKLLESGVMTAADYSAFVTKFDNNGTMLRLIARHASEAAKNAEDRTEAATLNAIALVCCSGQGKALREWDNLSEIADRCSGQSITGARGGADHIANMAAHWEDVAGAMIGGF